MRTQIIIKSKWKIIKSYPYVFTMNKEDRVEDEEGIEHSVLYCFLDIKNNSMVILLDD